MADLDLNELERLEKAADILRTDGFRQEQPEMLTLWPSTATTSLA